MKVLVKRRNLKGKQVRVAEDMAPKIANRLKQLKGKSSVQAAWFVNEKLRYNHYGDDSVKDLRSQNDLLNIT